MDLPLPEDRFSDPREFAAARLELYLERAREQRAHARYLAAATSLARLLAREPLHPEALALREEVREEVARLSAPVQARRPSRGLVLLVDQDDRVAAGLVTSFRLSGFGVMAASSPVEAGQILADSLPDVVVSEVNFHDGPSGLDFYTALRNDRRVRDVPFLFLATRLDRDLMIAGRRMGVDDMLQKPADPDVVVAAAQRAVHLRPAAFVPAMAV